MQSNTNLPKSSGKAPVKSVATSISSQPKKQKKRKSSTAQTGSQFRSAVKKCLKENSPDAAIKVTEKTLAILCGIADSLIEDIVNCSAQLAKKVEKETIGAEDVIASFDLILSGELRNLCVREIKCLMSKSQSKAQVK